MSVNCSMHDAVVLAERLAEHCGGGRLAGGDGAALESALAAYEEDMFARGRDLIRHSADNEARLFSDDGMHHTDGLSDSSTFLRSQIGSGSGKFSGLPADQGSPPLSWSGD